MSALKRYNDYGPLADLYENHWDHRKSSLFMLQKLLLPYIPKGSRVLDLCCGTGHLAEALVSRGFKVTGVDGSAEMLSHARKKLPRADFILADAREFKMPPVFKAVISTLDSLNHILKLEELEMVFGNVFNSLETGGYFLFDLNTEEAYRREWHKSSHIIKDDNVCIVHGGYDPDKKIGTTHVLMFFMEGAWKRSDLTFYQKCYSREEVLSALGRAGFGEIEVLRAREDLKMRGRLAIGRNIYRARK